MVALQQHPTESPDADRRVEALTDTVDTIARRLRLSLLALLGILLAVQTANGTPTAGWDVVVLLSAFASIGGILPCGARLLGRSASLPLTVELAGDSCAALACLLLIDTSNAPLAWLLLAVPVLVAGARHSMSLAALVWCSLIIGNVALELTYRPAALASASLVQAAQLLTAVGILGLPGSYLVRQLLHEARRRGAARQRAERQAAGISLVASAAHELSQSTSAAAIADVTVQAMRRLGFSAAEFWVRSDEGWGLSCRCSADSTMDADRDGLTDADQAQELHIIHADESAAAAQSLHLLSAASVAFVPVLVGAVTLRVCSKERIGEAEVEWLSLVSDHVRTAWVNVQRADDLASRTAALTYEVNHDPLTGLPNRTYLVEVIDRGLQASGGVTLLFVDLDGFKTINDAHGHNAGDLALITAGHRMREVLRTADVLGRLAGDEFVVVLATEATDQDRLHELAMTTAERLVQSVGQPFRWEDRQLQVGASVGIAHAAPGDEVHALLHRADQAMYEAKRAGGRRSFAAR